MPYVERNDAGCIISVSITQVGNACDEVDFESPELRDFIASVGGEFSALETTDFKFIRAIEDVIDVLISKNVICITDLPSAVQSKLMERRSLRHTMNALKLFGDDDQGTI